MNFLITKLRWNKIIFFSFLTVSFNPRVLNTIYCELLDGSVDTVGFSPPLGWKA